METISYIDRTSGEIRIENIPNEGMLKWLYASSTGKAALHILFKRKLVSQLGGWYMNSKLSAKRIKKFVDEYTINLNECQIDNVSEFKTFNHFFARKLKKNARQIGENLVSPADGKILVFQSMEDVPAFFVKGSEFTLNSFLQNKELAKKYEGGAMAIIRLAPADYHRFHFPASGKVSASKPIKGHYYSVSPLALRGSLKIFCENYREYCMLETKEYGDILISDVGATMVGSIIQTYQGNSEIKKGDEKGYFAFGGSTLVLFFEKGKISFDKDLILNTKNGLETYVRMGENIAS
uniref:phosphatidylserine decarboxylase n=1 Tax=uncultured Draconibacterium sp. TaxID=1573823 RepID=UPI003216ABD0